MNIPKNNLDFLKSLESNNNREWFEAHKVEFRHHQEAFKKFHLDVMHKMEQHDVIGGNKVYRIYRDVRFSPNKTPYKTYWAGSFKRAAEVRRGGYYYQIAPGRSYAAGGFFGPNSQDLLLIRKQISQDPDRLRYILSQKRFKNTFGQLVGDQVKTAPKGFSKEDEAIDLIRYKQFIVRHEFTDEEVLAKDFSVRLSSVFNEMRPYFDYMSEILTTDLNGVSTL